jgi:fumarate hydratase subunit alpha
VREIDVKKVEEVVRDLCIKANIELGEDVIEAFEAALEKERFPRAREVLERLLENARLAREEMLPICQDTGIVVVILEVPQDVIFVGGDLEEAINMGVRIGYKEGYLRNSIVKDPFHRVNTGDNTPAIIHTKITKKGERAVVKVVVKGGGSENMGGTRMLNPGDGMDRVKSYIVSHIRNVAPFSCPPLIVGVGIGGTLDACASAAKEALLRRIGPPNPDPEMDRFEREVCDEINRLGIGPAGLGGRTTALSVHIHLLPTHIASLPVAISVGCHANRHKEATI